MTVLDDIAAGILKQRDALSALISDVPPPTLPPSPPLPPQLPPQLPPVVGGTLSPEEIAEGCTKVVFFEGFDDPATIDLTAFDKTKFPLPAGSVTSDPTPALNAAGKPITFYLAGRQVPENFEIKNSVVTILKDENWFQAKGLTSLNGNNVRQGATIRGSAWFETMCCWDPTGHEGFPNVGAGFWTWGHSLRAQMEGYSASLRGNPDWIGEMDFLESPSVWGGFLMSLTQWYVSESPNPDNPYYNPINLQGGPAGTWSFAWATALAHDPIYKAFPDFDCRQMNRYATRYKMAADNGGTGIIKRFVGKAKMVDDLWYPSGPMVHLPELDFTWTSKTIGDPFVVYDQESRVLIIGCGSNPAKFDYVKVSQ